MGKQWPARSFKSGNSVAIRMPAALGIEPNREWTLEEREGEMVLRAKDAPKRKFNVEKVWGSAIGSGLRYVEPEDRVFENRPSQRDDPERQSRVERSG